MAGRLLKHRKLIKILRGFGVTENKVRGKGSHRRLVRTVGNHQHSTTISFHGRDAAHSGSVVEAIRRRLKLTEEDGVSDEDFYGK